MSGVPIFVANNECLTFEVGTDTFQQHCGDIDSSNRV